MTDKTDAGEKAAKPSPKKTATKADKGTLVVRNGVKFYVKG